MYSKRRLEYFFSFLSKPEGRCRVFSLLVVSLNYHIQTVTQKLTFLAEGCRGVPQGLHENAGITLEPQYYYGCW